MTYGHLLLMLQQDVNRTDKEQSHYPLWINWALREIQNRHEFSGCRPTAIITICPGETRAALPAGFKMLRPEKHPVHAVELAADGTILSEVPCIVSSREEMSEYPQIRGEYRRLSFSGIGAATQGYGPPVWLSTADGLIWFLNVLGTPATPLSLSVAYSGFLPELKQHAQANYLTISYPDLVRSAVKWIAFKDLNDPIAIEMEQAFLRAMQVATQDDTRRRVSGRALRMGGGGV